MVEFGQFVAVPVASQLLADGGAHVIKVETLRGDPIRMVAPLSPGESRYYITRNNGKHALPLALSDVAAKPVIQALVAKADVVLMNLRPGLPEKLGLAPQELLDRHPKLIVGSVSGFGLEGPEAGDAGMDLVVQARSGLMAANGRIVDGRPAAGDPVSADLMCAMTLAFGVSSALLRRERTGLGGILDTSLLQAAMMLTSSQLVRSEIADQAAHDYMLSELSDLRAASAPYGKQLDVLKPKGRAFMFTVYYRTFVTADSHIAVACGSHGLRVKFANALGFTDDGLSPAFSGDLEDHYKTLAADVEALVGGRTSEYWVGKLRAAGVPVSIVRMPVELYDDEQIAANGFLHHFEHPIVGPMTVVAPPIRLDGDAFRPGQPTASFGSETASILSELGFSAEAIRALLDAHITHDGLES